MHNQHSNPIDAEVKKIVPFSQTNKIELLLFENNFQTFLNAPKVRFDGTRSYELTNAQSCIGSDHIESTKELRKPSN